MQVTNEAGEIIWNASLTLFGKTQKEYLHDDYVTEQNLRFQGQYLDRELGLHYNTHRYYDPVIWRFTQPDPLGWLNCRVTVSEHKDSYEQARNKALAWLKERAKENISYLKQQNQL